MIGYIYISYKKMMENIVILGAGGLGREIQWLIERINEESLNWNILGYIDENLKIGTDVDGLKVIGNDEWLLKYESELAVACAVGNAGIRKKISIELSSNKKLYFPNLIDPNVQISKRVKLGKGNLICAGSIVTVDIIFGDFNIINPDCTIGHDVNLASFITIYPGVNIAGCVEIGESCEVGTGAQIIQGKKITENVTIGAGGVVVKDILESGTYVGVPVKRRK